MKKLIGLLLVGVMLIGLSSVAFAKLYKVPVKVTNAKGTLHGWIGIELQQGTSSGSWNTVAKKTVLARNTSRSCRSTLRYRTNKLRAPYRIKVTYLLAGNHPYFVEYTNYMRDRGDRPYSAMYLEREKSVTRSKIRKSRTTTVNMGDAREYGIRDNRLSLFIGQIIDQRREDILNQLSR